MPKGSQKAGAHIKTSLWIKEHLENAGEDHVLNMFNQMKRHFKTLKPGKEYQIGSYQTFRTFIWTLKKLDLITFVREEPVKDKIPRRYYALNQEKINDPPWNNPRDALYPKQKRKGDKR